MSKPHLRLEYTPGGWDGFVWRVVITTPTKRARTKTFWHQTARGALMSAKALWW